MALRRDNAFQDIMQQIQDLCEHNQLTQKAIASAETDLQATKDRLRKGGALVQNAMLTLADVDVERAKHQQRLDVLRQRHAMLYARWRELVSQCPKTARQSKQAEGRLAGFTLYRTWEAKLSTLSRTLTDRCRTKQKFASLGSQLETCRSERRQLEADVRVVRSRITDAKKHFAAIASTREKEVAAATVSAASSSLEDLKRSYQKQIQSSKARLQGAMQRCSSLQQQIARIERMQQ